MTKRTNDKALLSDIVKKQKKNLKFEEKQTGLIKDYNYKPYFDEENRVCVSLIMNENGWI
jgi:hypothetical protein